MARITRKEIKHDEFVDSTWRIVERLEENIKPIIFGAVAIVAVVAIVLGIATWQKARARAGADLLARAQAALTGPIASQDAPQPEAAYSPTFASQDQRYEEALTRLETAAEEGGGAAGRLATFLRGVALLEAGRAEEALAPLEAAVDQLGEDASIGGSVRARLAQAHIETGQLEAAAEIWRNLADEDGSFPGDLALLELGGVHEARGDTAAARAAYNELIEVYADSPLRSQAEERLAAL
jgi:predicted negative regulator of RcsB-dependent stress response